jgi:hypothetical protein
MNNPRRFPFKSRADQTPPGLAARVDELRAALNGIPPTALADRVGAEYIETESGRGALRLSLFDSPLIVNYPNLTTVSLNGDIQPEPIQALLLYHLVSSDGAPLTGKWVSFADLPDGRMYAQAMQGYTGNLLIKAFDPDLERFKQACIAAGGHAEQVGDAAFAFQVLPRVPLMVTYWLGDEDFPSSCKVLFDTSARNHVPIDVCAMLASMLCSRIVKAIGRL